MFKIKITTIKIKCGDVKPRTYIESSKINYQNSKFKIGDVVRVSKYKNNPWTYVINDLEGNEIV